MLSRLCNVDWARYCLLGCTNIGYVVLVGLYQYRLSYVA